MFDTLYLEKLYDFKDKERSSGYYIRYMLDRTQSMFEWSGLPDSIPQKTLELMLQSNGNVAFYKYNDDLYVFTGGPGGEPDVYYRPTIYTIANPALKLSTTAKIWWGEGEPDGDCVVMLNDALGQGLLPLFSRYATALVENDISLLLADVNSRVLALIDANDDKTYKSAIEYLKQIEEGRQGVIASSAFQPSINAQPLQSSHNALTDLIEYEQYLKACWWNELGLNANYNMKRESLNSEESQLNFDALLPLVDEMLHEREVAAEWVNSLFGTNISVELHGAWRYVQESHNLSETQTEADTGVLEEAGADIPSEEELPADGPEMADVANQEEAQPIQEEAGQEAGAEIDININIDTDGSVDNTEAEDETTKNEKQEEEEDGDTE